MIPEHVHNTQCPYLAAGECYWCCAVCNFSRHLCCFCGDDLDHHDRLPGGKPNPCYSEDE